MRNARARLAIGLGLGLVIAAAACGHELATQPDASLIPPPPPVLSSASRDSRPGTSSGTISVTFTIRPSDDNFVIIGPHFLVIPANSVCDAANSGYGEGTWDRPCSTIKRSITVTATAATVNGHPRVDFDTHLRFKPVQNYDRGAVMLYLRDNNATSTSKIDWCPSANSTCIDDAKNSATGGQLKTWFDASAYWIYRKIEHFSGYNVIGGRSGDEQDPNAGM